MPEKMSPVWCQITPSVCISNEAGAKDVFCIKTEATGITADDLNKAGYRSVAKQRVDKFGFEKVAITLRERVRAPLPKTVQLCCMMERGTASRSFTICTSSTASAAMLPDRAAPAVNIALSPLDHRP